jgi:ABC-type Fe3+-hydroxamate transport system substrate-binding protein
MEYTMKRDCKRIIALILALLMMICMTACKDDSEEAASDSSTAAAQTAADDEKETEEAEEPVKVVKTIEGIDEDIGSRLPLMIDSIVLYEDGSVAIIPTEDLKKNEIPEDDADAVYPFEESGKVADIYVMDYGNGGYRTIVALMKDGTISAVNGRALVEDHIFAIMDDVANKENFVSVENRKDEDASSIVAVTDDGEEVILDYSLNFDEPVQ